jgi:hypothetical protein
MINYEGQFSGFFHFYEHFSLGKPKTFYVYIKLIDKNLCCFKNWVLKLTYKIAGVWVMVPKITVLTLEKMYPLGSGHSQL